MSALLPALLHEAYICIFLFLFGFTSLYYADNPEAFGLPMWDSRRYMLLSAIGELFCTLGMYRVILHVLC